ncbi:hypothetical protein F0A17_02910 [Billgrantia pellis]|uniref:Uncharacterized protein n=1 Tax=Billgrantia pellis TaxID=2606936 RepID=A0A7V7G3J2_9GAMM|nr:hypothetical protein [Halomonas pellis]KAA0014610.1 hypothetical protein F0A17_02910 [Halomonas pellis]
MNISFSKTYIYLAFSTIFVPYYFSMAAMATCASVLIFQAVIKFRAWVPVVFLSLLSIFIFHFFGGYLITESYNLYLIKPFFFIFLILSLRSVLFIEGMDGARALILKLSKFTTIVFFLITFFQLLFPQYPIWNYMAEHHYHLLAMQNSIRPFGLLGNPTHSGYLALILCAIFLMLKERFVWFYLACSLLIFMQNKVSIITFSLLLLPVFIKDLRKNPLNLSALFLAILLGGVALYFILFKTFDRWAESSFQVHTINHRVNVYKSILLEADWSNLILWGDVEVFNRLSMTAFDSLPALLITQSGVLVSSLVVLSLLYKISDRRSFILFLVLVLPSLTMVAFFNFQYILFYALVYVFITSYLHCMRRSLSVERKLNAAGV